tara:strand:- start:279 stop:434 length:156 start_codon:yes stop_codon:yes gene_type:complete
MPLKSTIKSKQFPSNRCTQKGRSEWFICQGFGNPFYQKSDIPVEQNSQGFI